MREHTRKVDEGSTGILPSGLQIKAIRMEDPE